MATAEETATQVTEVPETETPEPAAEPTKPRAPRKPRKATGRTAKPKSDKRKNKKSKYGGTVGAPRLGANGRRLTFYLIEEMGPEKANEILAAAIKRTLDKRPHASRPKADRFIAWETIVAVAKIKDGEKLIRRLERQKGAKEQGLKD
ncbi:MAG TPA: hypothetical protein VFU96_02295, partial [Acidimicrobiia bacterium]|nr:hypothetical protein [Acidimicrobiia bacterium]